MTIDCFALLAGLFLSAEPAPQPAYSAGFDSIRQEELQAWVEFLAAGELRGRESGTRGYDVAARFAAAMFKGFGLAPGGAGGSYFQPFSLIGGRWHVDSAVLTLQPRDGEVETISLEGEVALRAWRDIDWGDPWVFAGFGEGADRDAPDDFHGLPLDGRVVLIVPPEGKTAEEDFGARARGARRLVVVSDHHVKRKRGHRRRRRSRERIEREEAAAGGVDVVYISSRVADRILSRWQTSVAALQKAGSRPGGFPLDGVDIRLRVRFEEDEVKTRNVVALLEGSDPRLKTELVVIGAHLDHVGARGDDEVFFGADDNASGSAALLGAASAFCRNGRRPRRSVVFALFGGEEMGLHGSRHYVDNPPNGPLDRIVLMINLDMVGRNEGGMPGSKEKAEDNTRSIHPVGIKRLSLELDPWARRLNESVGLEFEYDEERVFGRSDHYNFADRGIPVVFFFAGFHPDYHKPTDTPDKVNFDKLTRVTRLTFALAFEVSDRPRRLTVNRI